MGYISPEEESWHGEAGVGARVCAQSSWGRREAAYNLHKQQQQPGGKQLKQTLKGCFGLNPEIGSSSVR